MRLLTGHMARVQRTIGRSLSGMSQVAGKVAPITRS